MSGTHSAFQHYTPRHPQHQVPATPQHRAPASFRKELMEKKLLLASSNRASPPRPSSPLQLFQRTIKRIKEEDGREDPELVEIAAAIGGEEEEDTRNELPVNAIPTIKIELELGSGNFGQVSLVMCHENRRRYALKQHKNHMTAASKELYLEGLRRWDLLSSHKNIVPFFRAWQEDAKLCVLMAYCSGGTLEYYCQTNLVSEAQLLKCLRDMMLALEFMHHEHGLVHMDCKPTNICINQLGVCQLVDFDHLQPQGSMFNQSTDHIYMANEVMGNNYRADASADVFAMAISFLELALPKDSKLPRSGPQWEQLRKQPYLSKEFMTVLASHPKLADKIKPCLELNPQTRVSAKSVLAACPLFEEGEALVVSHEYVHRLPGNNRPESANLVTPTLSLGVEDSLSNKFNNSVLVSPKDLGLSSSRSSSTSPVLFYSSPVLFGSSPARFFPSSPIQFLRFSGSSGGGG
ncbi:hypothetical protein BASA81_009067 [Batrachochytrium salamandrivorans]|nr:hypothetical protein BASA81_009067 [Batrachochytrium salamandrivorans]